MNVLVSMKTRTVFGKVFSDCNSYLILSIRRFSDYNIYFIKFVGFLMIGSSDNSLIFTMAAFNITYLNIFLMKTGNVMPDLLAAKLCFV